LHPVAINCPYYFLIIVSKNQNTLKLAYATVSSKIVWPGYTPEGRRSPHISKGRGEGKREGGIRRNGRKEMGRKDEGDLGREKEGRKEGREDSL
jgi:hypothetical protein